MKIRSNSFTEEDIEEEVDINEAELKDTFDTVKQSVLRDVIVDDRIAISKQKVDSRIFEFNLYYDKFGQPIKRDIKNQNYYKVVIEIDKLKKAEPSLPTVDNKD